MSTILITKYYHDGTSSVTCLKRRDRCHKIIIQPHPHQQMMRRFGLSAVRKNWRWLKEKYGGLS